ncbi:MAG: cupredoxin domain-containing protein [Solirubrobacteraceae bacterium]
MRVRSLVLPILAAAVVAVVALALGNQVGPSSAPSSASTPAPAASVSSGAGAVQISNYDFKPKALTVKVGTRLTWTNHDSTAHTATADQGTFDTGTLNQGQSKTIDFSRPGTYTYHCVFHAFMTATIKVVG